MKIPTNLKHNPIMVSENYENIDGRNAYDSDAKGLSIGLAQWNDRGKVEFSAKVWRYTGEKWSRQSEEIPIHRVLDLAIFLCRTKDYFNHYYYKDEKEKTSYPLIDRIPLQGDAMNVAVCTDNPHLEEDIELLRNWLGTNDELLSERFRTLAKLLKELGF